VKNWGISFVSLADFAGRRRAPVLSGSPSVDLLPGFALLSSSRDDKKSSGNFKCLDVPCNAPSFPVATVFTTLQVLQAFVQW